MPRSQPPRLAPLPRIAPPRQPGHRACAALLWALAAFAALQVATVAVLEYRFPGLRDEEYGHKLGRLRKRLAEMPGRPLVLFMGTSRTLNGVIPSACPRTARKEARRRSPSTSVTPAPAPSSNCCCCCACCDRASVPSTFISK